MLYTINAIRGYAQTQKNITTSSSEGVVGCGGCGWLWRVVQGSQNYFFKLLKILNNNSLIIISLTPSYC